MKFYVNEFVVLKRILMHKERKCKLFCSQRRLDAEICSSHINMPKDGLLTEKYHQIRRKECNNIVLQGKIV